MSKFKEFIIAPEIGISEPAINAAEIFAKQIAGKVHYDPMSAVQLRKFFGEIKKLSAKGKAKHAISESSSDSENKTAQDAARWATISSDFYMLKAHLAYANGRDRKKKDGHMINKTHLGTFYTEIYPLINREVVNDIRTFKKFVQLMEAIVAYHKVHYDEPTAA